MTKEKIVEELYNLRDEKFRDFQIKLMPTVDPDSVIGVRTPALRTLAKRLVKDPDIPEFLKDLPHKHFDENQLHAFIISAMKDYEKCLAAVEAFLPYVDNWATCDQMSPKIFKKHRAELLGPIDKWMASGQTYTIRFGIGMLMEHFLDEDYDKKYLKKVAAVHSEEYYVNMMSAWYFATALAKQYDDALSYIEGHKLDVWTHNKAIQKAVESYRITPEQKAYLKTLKIKK
jgi:3-methyladenine DNA glycosylase AlkD